MLLERDLGFVYRVVAAALVVLFAPVGWLVVRWKWRHTLSRKEEIRRLLALASDEAARAEFEAAAGYSYGSPVMAEPEEKTAVSMSGSSPVWQSQYQCEVCFSPTTTRCKQCKAVHYWYVAIFLKSLISCFSYLFMHTFFFSRLMCRLMPFVNTLSLQVSWNFVTIF